MVVQFPNLNLRFVRNMQIDVETIIFVLGRGMDRHIQLVLPAGGVFCQRHLKLLPFSCMPPAIGSAASVLFNTIVGSSQNTRD